MPKDTERLKRLKKCMEGKDVDILICRLPENVLYITGYWPIIGASVVVFTQDGDTTLIVPGSEEEFAGEGWVEDVRTYNFINLEIMADPNTDIAPLLSNLWEEKNYGEVCVGYEGSFELVGANNVAAEARIVCESMVNMLKETLPGIYLKDASSILREARIVKSKMEIEKLRICNEIAAVGLLKARDMIKPGLREAQIAGGVEGEIYSRGVGYKGVGRARGFCFVMSGVNSAKSWRPFCISSSRRLVSGEPVLVELDTMADGYYNDLTRTFMVGNHSKKSKSIFKAVNDAVNTVIEEIKPGVEARNLDALARRILDKYGYGKYFNHQLGHGIGLQFHEPPTIHPQSRDVLEPGMTFAIEPGVYIPEWGGVRIEENVVVTENGCELLYSFPQWK